MSKIKKLVILCFMMLVGSFVVTNSVNAESKYFSYEDLCFNQKLLCVQHHQTMVGAKYNLIATINITGNKSTGNGKTVTSWYNAKLVSILSHDRGQGAYNNGDVENLPVQNAIWNYFKTWRTKVGSQHGIKADFVNNNKGNYTPKLEEEATKYANNYKDTTTLTDKTNKSKIKITSYTEKGENYLRVGPFKYEFSGSLSEIKVITDKNSNMKIKDFEKCVSSNKFSDYAKIENIKSGSEFYISVKMPTDGSSQIKKITVKNKVDVKQATIKFWEAIGHSQQNLLEYTYKNEEKTIETNLNYNIKLLGRLQVVKVVEGKTSIKLKGVGFKIKNKDTGKWVKKDKNNNISYVDKKENATEFVTNSEGKITIKNLIVGTYLAYETKNPNYGYEIVKDGKEVSVTVNKTTYDKIPNKQKYIKLSGYVWVDKIFGKQSTRNDLYKDNDYDSNDILLDGITVKLIDKTTNKAVKQTKTANKGKYTFKDVLVEDLDKYYIEFIYDGLTYTNVVPHINKDNGSKAAENSKVRTEFNKGFSSIEGKTSNTGITRDEKGNEKYQLNYNVDKKEHKSILNNTGLYPITATTNETKYKIKDHYVIGQTEIKNINLGLYEREQPDIALVKDLYNVNVTINGYNHIYEYAQRFKNAGEYGGEGFNVGVKFGNKYGNKYGNMSYTRAIYEADKEYTSEDKSKELKVYVTYKISMKNESSNLKVKVNSILDYYDSNYTLTKVGTGIDNSTGNITGEVTKHEDAKYNDKYNKVIIDTNSSINAGESSDIYVQFELNRDAVLKILNNKENLENVTEINSYSVFDTKGKLYAGIDQDSNPGNAVPGDETTYEDDTDSAPGLKLEVADNAREMTGKVFLDSTSSELKTGEVRQGDGMYTDGEKGIKDVKVTLKENTGSGKVYEAKTDENGDFYISGYIPGDYTLTYTWGDKEYTVQNYKGTVYDKDRYDANVTNKEWYKKEVEKRYTDAVDDYEQRKTIDDETKTITNSSADIKNTTMDSTTPTMGISVEYESTTTTETTSDKFIPQEFKINNIDFGIVERAKQQLSLRKRVSSFKATLANGQVIADCTIDENGNITGETNHLTYVKPVSSTDKGFVKLELDSELIQGAKVEVVYEIKATNNSELDYDSEEFYKYGKQTGNKITIKPSAIIDYLDKNWSFEQEKNTDWTVKSIDDIKDMVAKEVYEDTETTIADKIILYTDSLSKQSLEPTKSATVNLNVSKILSNSDEISLDNEAEITKIEKTGGSKPDQTPGNYVPGKGPKEVDDSTSETVMVTPNTGDNLAFAIPVMVGVVALVILGVGVVIIKKKTL